MLNHIEAVGGGGGGEGGGAFAERRARQALVILDEVGIDGSRVNIWGTTTGMKGRAGESWNTGRGSRDANNGPRMLLERRMQSLFLTRQQSRNAT